VFYGPASKGEKSPNLVTLIGSQKKHQNFSLCRLLCDKERVFRTGNKTIKWSEKSCASV
jgi:hypothetical protein